MVLTINTFSLFILTGKSVSENRFESASFENSFHIGSLNSVLSLCLLTTSKLLSKHFLKDEVAKAHVVVSLTTVYFIHMKIF